MSTLLTHLESFLGVIAGGIRGEEGINVAKFYHTPAPGILTSVTCGLSMTPLALGGSKLVRQELMFSCDPPKDEGSVGSFLISFAEWLRRRGRALERGEVIGPADPIVPGSRFSSVYASIPVFFPDDFYTYKGVDPSVVIVWLMPLMSSEAEFVKRRGWNHFETCLEKIEVDYCSWDREAMSLDSCPVDGAPG